MTIRVIRHLLTLPCAVAAAWVLGGQQAAFAQNIGQLDVQPLGDGMGLLQIRPNFYVLTGAGANVGVQVGTDGVVVVDAGDAAHADRLIAEIKKLTPRPIRYIINTSPDADHVGGNEKVSKAGRTVQDVLGGLGPPPNGGAAAIMAAEGVLVRMSTDGYPEVAWPTEAFAQPRRYMYLNDEGIEALHQPNAHSDADSLVFFRRSDVVMAGDIVDIRHFPVIDVANGGTINGEIAALNRLVELAIPSVPIVSRDAGTIIVPSHGRPLDQLDVAEYRDVVTIIRDRVENLKKQGKTLAQVKASNPTEGYRTRYGSDTGPWTTDMFVEAVYKSLPADKSKSKQR